MRPNRSLVYNLRFKLGEQPHAPLREALRLQMIQDLSSTFEKSKAA